jgi:hypothetical protein
MKNTLFFLFLLVTAASFAQEKKNDTTKKTVQFRTIAQGGLLAGSSGEAAVFQAIHGVEWKRFYVGVGVGLDYYMQRGVPLFADLRYRFSTQRKSFFVYTDAGVHMPWVKHKEERNIISQGAGLYTDVGIGVQLNTRKQDAFLISAGYSYKHVSETKEGFGWWSWPTPGGQNDLHFDYHFNRIALKFGFMF